MNTKTINPEIAFLHNLCEDSNLQGIYRPMGKPRQVGTEGYRLLTNIDDRQAVAGREDGTFIIEPGTGSARKLTAKAGKCGCRISEGRLAIMTGAGMEIFENNEKGELISKGGEGEEWGAISITAEETTPLTLQVEEMSLSREYNPGDVLLSADRNKVRRKLIESYEFLANQSAEQGVFFQPLLARAIIKDRKGNIVHRGPEVLITPPGGLAFDSALMIGMENKERNMRLTKDVPTYRLRVRCEPMTNQEAVERGYTLAVEVSPCFHTWHPNIHRSGGSVTPVRQGTSGLALSATMPGAERGLSRNDDPRNERHIAAVLKNFESIKTTVAQTDSPYERGIDIVASSYGCPDLYTQFKMTQNLTQETGMDTETDKLRLQGVNAPHSIVSEQMISTPSAILFGNIGISRYPGYSPTDYAAETEDTGKGWIAKTTVSFADGTQSWRIAHGRGNKPIRLNPLISYPDKTARMIEIVIEDTDGGSPAQSWRMTLRPDTSGTRAISISHGLKNEEPTTNPGGITGETATRRSVSKTYPGLIATSHPDNPLQITALYDLGSAVTALTNSTSTSGVWDFGRTRFYAFTSDKTIMVNISTDMRRIATAKLAELGVKDRGGVTFSGTQGVYFVSAKGNIYQINGTRVKGVLSLPTEVDRLGFDPTDQRLTASHSTGAEPFYHIDAGKGRIAMTSTSPGPMDEMMTCGIHLLAPTQSGLYDLAVYNRTPDEGENYVRMTSTLKAPMAWRPNKMKEVIWNVESENFKGTMTLKRRYLSPRTSNATSYTIEGAIRSPLRMAVVGRRFTNAVLEISGTVSGKTYFWQPEIKTTD